MFHGRPVISIEDYRRSDGETVFFAVHESNLPAVAETAGKKGIRGIWVCPYMHELLYGKPVARGKQADLQELIRRQDPECMWLAARFILLLSQEGLFPGGDAVYRKALMQHTNAATAERRAAQALDLFRSLKENGFCEEHPLAVDEDGLILDGLHRAVICRYLGIEKVTADIYPKSAVSDQVLRRENRLYTEDLPGYGFTEGETATLKSLSYALRGSRQDSHAEGPAVSVILPAYNVAGYVRQCLESVCGQTFADFEAFLIDDGSSDDTLSEALAFAESDARVHVVSRKNGGVATARNLGIELACGTYLAFIDPDDWVDRAYLEKLYACAQAEDADFVECDLYRYNGRNGSMIRRSCGSQMGIPYTDEEHMIYGPTASYKAVSRRSLWNRYGIRFPSCSFESPAVYALLLSVAEKKAYVPEPLYYYRRFRENSLVESGYARPDGRPDPGLGTDAMDALIRGFRRCGTYAGHERTIERIVKYRLSDILAMQYHRRTPEDYRAISENCFRFVRERYPDSLRYFVFGGYNLNRILLHVKELQDPDNRFNFSSLAALRGTPLGTEARHPNVYRRIMLQREWDRSFYTLLQRKKPDFLFLDLMEERFDLIRTAQGYITCSDAYEGAEVRTEGERIGRDTEECGEVFREAFADFVTKTGQILPGLRIVVFENYLCTEYGDLAERIPYEDQEGIRSTNEVLRGYYAFIKEQYPEIPVTGAADSSLYFTDRQYEYGAVPSHLNEQVNRIIAGKAEEIIYGL